MHRLLCAALLAASALGSASAQLFAAIAPEARSAQIGGPDVTLFVTAINNTDETLTQCQPVAEFFEGLTFQTVDSANQLTGSANTPVTLNPRQTQGFVIALPTTQVQLGRLVARVECAELNSVRQFAIGATINIVERDLADIIAIGQTPSADGVVRIPEPGGTEVFAVAGVNIGAAANVDVTARGTDYMPSVSRFSVCETGKDGACLQPPSQAVNVDFGSGEVRTFSVFSQAGPDAGVPFMPDLQRVRLVFEDTEGGWEVGAASAALTAPAPQTPTNSNRAGIYAAYYSRPDGDTVRIDQGFVLIDDFRALSWGARPSIFGGHSGEWLLGGMWNTSINQETGTYSYNGQFLTTGFDRGFSQADFATDVDAGRGFTGEIGPSNERPDLAPASETVNVRAAYDGFLSNAPTPYEDMVGDWHIISGSSIIGELEVRENATMSGRFTTGTISNCFFVGDFVQSSNIENMFQLEMRFQTSAVGCASFFNGEAYRGLAFVGTDARPVPVDAPMIAFLYDEIGPERSALSLLLAKRN